VEALLLDVGGHPLRQRVVVHQPVLDGRHLDEPAGHRLRLRHDTLVGLLKLNKRRAPYNNFNLERLAAMAGTEAHGTQRGWGMICVVLQCFSFDVQLRVAHPVDERRVGAPAEGVAVVLHRHIEDAARLL